MTRKRLDLIQKIDKITTIVGTIIDSLTSNSSTDAPSIRAVKDYFNKGSEEKKGNTCSGLASDYGIEVVKIEGNYEQKTTNGYQLFDFLETLSLKNLTEIIDNSLIKTSCIIDVTKQKSVCFKCDNYTIFDYNILRVLQLKEYPKIGVIGVRSDISSDTITKFSDDVKYLLVVVIKNPGITNNDIYKANLMINYGSEYLPWEPYTGGMSSPSPEYPQEIKSVEITKFNSHTNQLFDASRLPTKSQGGATVTNNGDGSFTISGSGNLTSTYSINLYKTTHEEFVRLVKSKELNLILKGDYVYPFFSFSLQDKNTNENIVEVKYNNLMTTIKQEYLDNPNIVIVCTFYGALGNAIIPGVVKPMVWQDGDGTWEPFKLVTTTLSKPLILRALPNGVRDTYENGIITRRVGEMTFDGSGDENWVYEPNQGVSRFCLGISDMKNFGFNREACLNSRFFTMLQGHTEGGSFFYDNRIFIYPPSNLTTAPLLKTWLQSNNLKVWYELATPVTEQFSIPTLPSFYPYTNVHHDSVIEANNIIWNVNTSSMNVSNNMDTFNTDKRSPSIDAVNNEINNLKESGIEVSDTLVLGSQFLFDGDESELPSYLKKVDPPFSNPSLLINDSFQVWQRGETFNTVGTMYTSDRWKCTLGASQTISSSIDSNLKGLCLSKGSISQAIIRQPIETSNNQKSLLLNKDVTLSFRVYVNKALTFKYRIGTLNEQTFISDKEGFYNVEYTTTLTSESFNNGYLDILLFNNQTDECIICFECAKLELGSIATPFIPRSYAEELMLCQRYYQIIASRKACTYQIPDYSETVVDLPIELRVSPTVSYNELVVQNLNGERIERNGNPAFSKISLNSYLLATNHATNGLYPKYIVYRLFLDAEIY